MDSDRLTPRQLWEDVIKILRRDILAGTLAPGIRLVEADLAERFGVSRGPIRDALRELGRVGLVAVRPRQGVFVSTPTESDLAEITATREALETAAARIALAMVTPEDLERLRTSLEAMEQTYEEKDGDHGLATDLDFHREIFQIADNSRMLRAHDELASQLLLAATRNKVLREGVYPPAELHRRIYDALAAGDEAALVCAVQEHYAWTGDRLFGPLDGDVPSLNGTAAGRAARRRLTTSRSG